MPEPTPDTLLERQLRGHDEYAVPMIQRRAADEIRRLRMRIVDLEVEVLLLKEIIMSRGPQVTEPSRIMTLKEHLAEEHAKAEARIAQRHAFEATPEGRAKLEADLAEMRADMEIDRKWARENPPDPEQE